MPFAGFFYSDIEVLSPYHFLFVGLPEFLALILVALHERIRNGVSLWLLLVPTAAFPSLIMAGEQALMSAYFIVMLSLCAFLYESQLRNMALILKKNIIDSSIIVMVLVGLLGKAYSSLAPGLENTSPLIFSFLIGREGAIAGSNFIAQLMLTLLPLSRNRIVKTLSIGFLLFTFSRGVYLCLAIYLIWMLFFSSEKMQLIRKLMIWLVILMSGLIFIKSDIVDYLYDFTKERIISHQNTDIESRYQNEERFKIFEDALKIANESSYLGIGLGGFYYAHREMQDKISDNTVSNAHNLYLTLLAEGGLCTFLLFTFGFITSFFRAMRTKNNEAGLSILILIVYFLFSGSIYESSRYVTLSPYYLWIFLLAYIKYMESFRVKSC